jgi:Holliday junction resolvase RusA-like endonuclease
MKFIISGIPLAKARPRFSFKTGHAYDSQKKESAKIKLELESQMTANAFSRLVDRPIEVYVCFHMSKIKKRQKGLEVGLNSKYLNWTENQEWHIVKPDLDNLIKEILDCLKGIAYTDDCLICKLYAEKIRSDVPRTEIEVREIL